MPKAPQRWFTLSLFFLLFLSPNISQAQGLGDLFSNPLTDKLEAVGNIIDNVLDDGKGEKNIEKFRPRYEDLISKKYNSISVRDQVAKVKMSWQNFEQKPANEESVRILEND